MISKIKENQSKFILVLSIIAGALLLPSIFLLFSKNITENTLISLLINGGLIATNVLIAVFSSKGKLKNYFLIFFTLFFVILAVKYFDLVLAGKNVYVDSLTYFNYVVYLVLYIAIIVLNFVSKKNSNCKKVLYICLLVSLAFLLTGIFAGSNTYLSIFLTVFSLLTHLYLSND